MRPDTPPNDLDLLPEQLRSQSLSRTEIVLPYAAALEAIAHLRATGVGLLGWEGWVSHSNGHVGHASFQGTMDIVQGDDESWEEYVNRSADFCVKTIMQDQASWNSSPDHPAATLCFCITVDSSRRT
jgi:hypothetical protein